MGEPLSGPVGGIWKGCWEYVSGKHSGNARAPGGHTGGRALESRQEQVADLGYGLVFWFTKGKLGILGLSVAPRVFSFTISAFSYPSTCVFGLGPGAFQYPLIESLLAWVRLS